MLNKSFIVPTIFVGLFVLLWIAVILIILSTHHKIQPPPPPPQSSELRITNQCDFPIWIEGRYGALGQPIPGQDTTRFQISSNSWIDFDIPEEGLAGTRFWAKYGCNNMGMNCEIGDQSQYWPSGGCPTNGCTPPIDSLFEATFGCLPNIPQSQCAVNPSDPSTQLGNLTWFDTSLVDGFTFPFKLNVYGNTSSCDYGVGFNGVDASQLDLSRCPTNENLSNNGEWPSITNPVVNITYPLDSVDLTFRSSDGSQILGCYAPCHKTSYGYPFGFGQSEALQPSLWFCCPTPDPQNCQVSEGCVTSSECRAGPITNTQYVTNVHAMVANAYAFAYDDGVGDHNCPRGQVQYEMIFCPTGSVSYPLSLNESKGRRKIIKKRS